MIEFLTAPQLATRWGMSVHTLANWRCKGVGPNFIKLGGVRYPLASVQVYEAKLTREAAQAPERRKRPRPVASHQG